MTEWDDRPNQSTTEGEVMTNPIEQFAKGEPVFLGDIIFYIAAAIGLKIDTGMSMQLGLVVAGLLATWLKRRNATPAANPAVPTLVVQDGKVGAVPPPQPVITFAGRRA